jgi:hypothetical protein
MSASSSNTDGSTTPPAPDPNNALKVAIMFVKQYYKCLSSHPEMLERFYSPNNSSYLSHGEGSEPTEPSPLNSTNHGHGRWGCSGIEAQSEKMLFEFEDGAIDAQPSQNEGILMVVTASVIFTSRTSGAERRKQFVQTFFLAKIGRNFAVTNDILRFLAVNENVVDVAVVEPEVLASINVNANAIDESSTDASEKQSVATPEPKQAVAETTTTTTPTEPSSLVQDEKKTDFLELKASSGDESSAPGGGVEESKVEAPLEEEAAAVAAAATDASKKRSSSKENKGKKNNKGGKQQKQQQQQKPAASKPAPGSWASLVVSGGSVPNTPIRTQEKKVNKAVSAKLHQPPLPPSDHKEAAASESKDNVESSDSQKKTQEKANSNITKTNNHSNAKNDKSNNNNKTNKDKERTKRDPDNTLVIKNLSENIKEQDILNMFQPFAAMTKSKIVGTNLNHHRMLAFVDYDSVAPVNAALKKHKENPFEWNGKVLEVDQKTLEQRARRKAGGNTNTNNQNNNNNNEYRNANAGGAGRGGNNNYSNNGRGDGPNDRGARRRGTRAGR